MNAADKSWLITILVISGNQAYGAIAPVTKGEIPDPQQVRRAYALTAIFTLGLAVVFAAVTYSRDPIVAALPIILASVAVQEWAIAISSVEAERKRNGE